MTSTGHKKNNNLQNPFPFRVLLGLYFSIFMDKSSVVPFYHFHSRDFKPFDSKLMTKRSLKNWDPFNRLNGVEIRRIRPFTFLTTVGVCLAPHITHPFTVRLVTYVYVHTIDLLSPPSPRLKHPRERNHAHFLSHFHFGHPYVENPIPFFSTVEVLVSKSESVLDKIWKEGMNERDLLKYRR